MHRNATAPTLLLLTSREVDRTAAAAGVDRRSVLKELAAPNSVRGKAGERVREALAKIRARRY